jgi:hypothetical protein
MTTATLMTAMRQPQNTCGGDRGGSYSDTTTAAPHGSDSYTSWPLYFDPWIDTIQM